MHIDEMDGLLAPCLSVYSVPRLLDLGGGPGRFADALLVRHPLCQVVVADSSELLLSRNQPHPQKSVLSVDALRLTESFRPHSFEVIFLRRLLHHLVGDSYTETVRLIQEVLCQCAAVLKPDGRLSIIENIWNGRFSDGLSGRLLYYATSSRLFAPVARRMGSNTAGTGVCYVSDRLLTCLLKHAGFCVEVAQVFGNLRFPWYVRYPMLLKSSRSVHYWCRTA